MLLITTNTIEGKQITHYYGVVSGETIIGANLFRDLFAGIRDIVGGRAASYEEVLRKAKDTALQERLTRPAKWEQMPSSVSISIMKPWGTACLW